MLVSVPCGVTSMSAPSRVKPTAMLPSMLRSRTTPVKIAPAQIATADQQKRRAPGALPEILQRQTDEQKPHARRSGERGRPRGCLKGEVGHGVKLRRAAHNVHERVCFMCSSLVGMITLSWCPPLLGKMPISSSVAASTTAMPLDSR